MRSFAIDEPVCRFAHFMPPWFRPPSYWEYIEYPWCLMHGWSEVKTAEKVKVEFVEIQHELLHLPLIQILFKGRTFCARTFLIAKALLMAHNKGRRRQGQYSTSLCISGKLQVKNRNWCGEKKIITHLPKSLLKWSIKDNRHQVSNILYFTFAMLSICGKTWKNLNWGFNLCQIDETKNLNIFKKNISFVKFH